MATSGNAPSVSLNRNRQVAENTQPPVWAIDNAVGSQNPPLQAKCARHVDERQGVCCKELKPDDERQLVDPDIIRDAIIGLSDGLTVPFALTAGLSSIGSSRIVVAGGVAELIAGAISMGIGGFLASQAERDHYRYLRRTTRARVLRSCAGEMEREVHQVLGPLGLDEKLSRQVADALLKVEEDSDRAGDGPVQSSSSSSSSVESGLRWAKDVGLSAFLLKFGEGLEEVPNKRMYISALTIGSGYLMGGIIPLIPYFFIDQVGKALMWSSIITVVVLLIFGVIKARISGAAQSKLDYAWGAISTMLVGGTAAAVAYGVVYLLETDAQ